MGNTWDDTAQGASSRGLWFPEAGQELISGENLEEAGSPEPQIQAWRHGAGEAGTLWRKGLGDERQAAWPRRESQAILL